MAKRIGIVFNEGRQDAVILEGELGDRLRQRGEQVLTIPWQVEEIPPIDLLIVLGGDGTFLRGANLVSRYGTPILGVNLGTLGFLAETASEEAYHAVEAFFAGELEIEERVMLDVTLFRGGQMAARQIALNDGVISKGSSSRLVSYSLFVDAVHVSSYSADGVIVATPTGSTAYALSAGGPILAPDVPGFTIVPVCPHSLTARPLVVSDRSTVKVSMSNCYDGAVLSVDGRKGIPLLLGDEILLSRSAHLTHLIKYSRGFFDKLRTKLHWGGKPVG
ncbi:MAG TPA: NAD(+)/NADH kinase [Chroococcales cyanobacterium]